MRYYTGRVAVITGAGSGIGRALAVALADQEAVLALSDVDPGAVAATERLCGSAAAIRTDTVDVTDRRAVLDYASAVAAEFGRVDLVFAVAGVIFTGSVLSSDFADIEHVMNVDFWGVVHTAKAFLPHVIASGGGHVVTVSSAFGLIAAPLYSAYNSAKFAVRGFTESLRQEMLLAGHPVSVTCVYPGGVRTPIMRNSRCAEDEDLSVIAARFDSLVARTEPAEAASIVLRGVRSGRADVLVGVDARIVSLVVRAAGRGYQRVLPALHRLLVARRGANQKVRP
ncbi:MAG TPA: SDR family oxidoreductase [Pseudonocardiaceae bacterium]|nr:SDR family oxidoreductase [Pseudonocardiaceae bacterium]